MLYHWKMHSEVFSLLYLLVSDCGDMHLSLSRSAYVSGNVKKCSSGHNTYQSVA